MKKEQEKCAEMTWIDDVEKLKGKCDQSLVKKGHKNVNSSFGPFMNEDTNIVCISYARCLQESFYGKKWLAHCTILPKIWTDLFVVHPRKAIEFCIFRLISAN